MSDQRSAAVILAAGLGTRMRSSTPKPLHPVAGRPMIDLLLDSVAAAGLQEVVVVVNPAQPEVAAHIGERARLATQEKPLGSGHALLQAPEDVFSHDEVVVLNVDSPLVTPQTLVRLVAVHRESGAAATLATVIDPGRNDGRVIRDAQGGFKAIVEAKDATEQQLRGQSEINVGIYCFRGPELRDALSRLRPDNSAHELYLTDVFRELRPVEVMPIADSTEALGINDRSQLARAERVMRSRHLDALMLSGVTVTDPDSCFVDAGVRVGRDTTIEPFTILRGTTEIGIGCRIGPYADIRDSRIGDEVRVEHAWLDGAEIGSHSDCGPFVKLRPGTRIGEHVHVGSFAELVRTSVDSGSAVPHVSYLGDTTIGKNVNVGAGTITANYDGLHKNATVIEDDCFVGVDTMFVAPRRMARGSRTGAGAVVTKDIPSGTIAVGVPARAIKRRSPAPEEPS